MRKIINEISEICGVSGIYKIVNLVNNKLYVGQSRNIKERKKKHEYSLSDNNHTNKHLLSAVNKYGLENFLFEVIEIVDVDLLDERETFWIKQYKSNEPKYGYNKDSGPNNKKRNKDIVAKIASKNKGRKRTLETIKKLSNSHKGIVLSNETKLKMSKTQIKRYENIENRNKIKDAMPKKSVLQYDMYNNLIAEYISSREAERITGISHISCCCNNKRNSAGGYVWKYK